MRRRWLALLLVAAAVTMLTGSAARGDSLSRQVWTVALGATAPPQLTAETPITWCGTGETPDGRLPQADPLSGSTVRILYAYPRDAENRFAQLADAIVSDVAAIDDWWRSEDPTRAPRWDTFAFPGCGSGLESLDLGSLALSRGGAAYAASSGFDRIAAEAAAHLGSTEKAIVFYDGEVIDPGICGVSLMAPHNGGPYGVSVVALRSDCWVDLGTGRSTSRVAVHELVHGLGAVPSKAPNRCGDTSLGGHACDSPSDLMFPYASAELVLPDAVLDFGHDDYYAHPSDWWDVQDSAWLVHLPRRTLTVTSSGTGSVSSEPPAISCPGTCTVVLDGDFVVRLVATPEPGSELYGWKGACTGEGICRLTMTRDISVSAVFGPPRPVLTVRTRGRGKITSLPSGIACPGRCVSKFPKDTMVKLHARPATGWRFRGWSGGYGSKPTCNLPVTTSRALVATFVRRDA